jgi:hypothetical protein
MSDPMDNRDPVRAAFEKWFSEDGKFPRATERSDRGEYLLAQAASSWTAWQAAWAAARAAISTPSGLMARPLSEYHEDMGPVLWWRFPVNEAPYVGDPSWDNWEPDFYTHWTPLQVPADPPKEPPPIKETR